ncbi:hypothetical protein EBR77_00705 [bacterium]|nr:hypothetical protein [bacterium]
MKTKNLCCEICGSDHLAGPTCIFSRRKKNGVYSKATVFCHECFAEYYALVFGVQLDKEAPDMSEFLK